MTERCKPIEKLAAHLGGRLPSDDRVREALSRIRLVFAGFGSIARPMSGAIVARGARDLTIVDPKSYVERSVHSQCDQPEVGRAKVDVGARQLRCLGANVRAFERDLYDVPDGIVDCETLVVATVDNRRGDIGANRLASRMGARLLKINIEPELGTVTARAYDFRHATSMCGECQFGDRHYETQRHPRSCDGAVEGRSTNSPRWLSRAAANFGLLAAIELALDAETAHRWFGCEWQFRVDAVSFERSLLSSRPDCRWDHSRRWPAVERIAQGPALVTLADLFGTRVAEFGSGTRIRFCHSVALSGVCRQCGRHTNLVRWTCHSDPQAAVGECRHCGGGVVAPGFWKFSELEPRRLAAVWDSPLADWGVEPFAVLSLYSDDQAHTFVINA
jgi:hypothetical protein